MIMEIERIIPEDEQLRKYGIFIKMKTNGHNEQRGDDSNLSATDLQEIEDLISIDEDSQ